MNTSITDALSLGQTVPLSSSNVESCSWRDDDLTVTFLSGGTYRYRGVPFQVAVQFVNAASPGKFVWQHLRGRYATERIG